MVMKFKCKFNFASWSSYEFMAWWPLQPPCPPELYWEPENEKHEWNFQGEMSSSVWRRLDILHIIRKADFSPNWFEQALHFYSAVYKVKVQSPSSRFRRISTAFDMPIALHIDLNAAKTNETHDTLFDFAPINLTLDSLWKMLTIIF